MAATFSLLVGGCASNSGAPPLGSESSNVTTGKSGADTVEIGTFSFTPSEGGTGSAASNEKTSSASPENENSSDGKKLVCAGLAKEECYAREDCEIAAGYRLPEGMDPQCTFRLEQPGCRTVGASTDGRVFLKSPTNELWVFRGDRGPDDEGWIKTAPTLSEGYFPPKLCNDSDDPHFNQCDGRTGESCGYGCATATGLPYDKEKKCLYKKDPTAGCFYPLFASKEFGTIDGMVCDGRIRYAISPEGKTYFFPSTFCSPRYWMENTNVTAKDREALGAEKKCEGSKK